MSHAPEIARQYLEAFGRGDLHTCRSLLADDGFKFVGPMDRFTDADDLVASLARLGPVVRGVEVRNEMHQGDQVCTVYDLKVALPFERSRIAEWMRIEGGKIQSIEIFFDAAPFAAAMGG